MCSNYGKRVDLSDLKDHTNKAINFYVKKNALVYMYVAPNMTMDDTWFLLDDAAHVQDAWYSQGWKLYMKRVGEKQNVSVNVPKECALPIIVVKEEPEIETEMMFERFSAWDDVYYNGRKPFRNGVQIHVDAKVNPYVPEQYSKYTSLNDSDYGYDLIGYDNKGLHYFLRENKDELIIAVMDNWSKKIWFYDYTDVNPYKATRNEYGEVKVGTSWFVSENGDIYFTTLDVDKKEYQIKKITNCWYKDLGLDKKTFGMVNANHIELYEKSNLKSKISAYVYENDIVIEVSRKGNFSKVKTVNGLEGWVETKYINF